MSDEHFISLGVADALAKKYLGDPGKRFATARERFEDGMKYARTSTAKDASKRAFESIFTEDVVQIITVLRESGDRKGARDIQQQALKVLDNTEIKNALTK